MPESRSASQILFGFLPNQTVDLKGAIWKVTEWRNPIRENAVDISTLRRELRHLAAPWAAAQKDGGYVLDLVRNRDINVVRLDKANGVDLEPFPKTWLCKGCRRILGSIDQRCVCGHDGRPRQLQFVGYCSECGTVRAPYVPRCPQHQQVRVTFPGTASASEIEFGCPICSTVLRKGFGFARCDCGQGPLTFNVHRAASVYTARSVVIVNPPSPERLQQLMAAGGPPRALAWVLDGMKERNLTDIPLTREVLRQQLMAQRVPLAVIEAMLRAADSAGGLDRGGGDIQIAPDRLEEAQSQAVTIALACAESRVRVSDLVAGSDSMSEIGVLYRDKYPACLDSAGIEAIELCEKFPVLTGMFGYTRGPTAPGASKLNAFRERNGNYRVYADVAETEALFVRLSPSKVVNWLRTGGFSVQESNDGISARMAILNACMLPDSSGQGGDPAGSALLTLVHSFAHRFIRLLAVHAGIDRNALSELLVPAHLGFYVYAAARGDFVLGGLQAVFEGELDRLLYDFVHGERRCALDPGCRASGGACMACLHLGEPSCRYYNAYLDRNAMTGAQGFLGMA
jgi:hypothetical protein